MTTKQYDNYADLITFTRASSGTYLDSDGLLKTASTNVPRIEYDASGNRKGLLIEEARTNLVTYGTPTISNWIADASVTESQGQTSPAGDDGANSITLVDNGDYIYANATVSASTAYTFSWYAKAGTATAHVLGVYDNTNAAWVTQTQYTLTNGEDVGNGWYRQTYTFTTPVGCTSVRVYPTRSNDGGGLVSASIGSTILYGAQLEEGSFATSYIPTSGSTATRSADVASIPTSAFGYNSKVGAGGTVIVDFQSDNWTDTTNTQFFRVWNLNPTSGSGLFKAGLNNGQFRYRLNDTANNAVFGPDTISSSAALASVGAKIAIAYVRNDFALYSNGSQVTTDSEGLFANELATALWLGSEGGSGSFANGHIKSIQYYPRRLTNAQLQELTS